MIFRTNEKKLTKVYEKKKNEIIKRSPDPVSFICKKCWYQAKCIQNIIQGHKPNTCCIYELFSKERELSLEKVVKFVCNKRCTERQQWRGDPVPHTKIYCERFCPMSRYILDLKTPSMNEVPYKFGY